MNSLLNSNSKSSNSNISNNSTHLAQLNHQLNSLQVNQSSSFQAQLQQQQQQQQSNGQLIPHQQPQLVHHNAQLKYNRDYIENLLEGDLILQALNGFLFIITCDGMIFYISHTVETYLGYPQADVCHQSVYDFVHSEDREELQRHLTWNSALPNDKSNMTLAETLQSENCQYLERNFTARFRCLLDNTSGFLRLDIRGRVKVLHGQNLKKLHETNYNHETPLALFAVCTPFGPPSLLEMPSKETLFKSKHRLDFSFIQLDNRGKQLLGYSDTDLTSRSCYDLVHHDDLSYVASAHQELLKTGASGLIAYRLCTKNAENWQWLQTSARLVYKNSKADFIFCTHRPLMEEEGRDLYGKRTMDFKVTYLDGGLGAMSAADRNSFDCLTNEKASDYRSTSSAAMTSATSTKSSKPRKVKSEKNAQLANAILNRTNISNVANSTASAAAFAAINSGINPNSNLNATGFEHALNYTPNATANLAQSNRYNGLTDYYAGSHSNAAAAAAYYNGTASYPAAYNSQTNVTIINNNYNLSVTQNGCLGSANLPTTSSHVQSASNALTNENSSCSSLSSNSSFSSCSASVKKKFTSTNDDYDQFNHLINGHSFHPATSNSTATHLVNGGSAAVQQQSQQQQSTSSHHLSPNQLNININNLGNLGSISSLNQNAMLLNSGNTNSFNSASNANLAGLNGNFVYSPGHNGAASNLSPTTVDHQLSIPNSASSVLSSTHAQQLQLVGLSHGSSPLSNSNTQLSPLSTTSNSNQIQALEAMEVDSAPGGNQLAITASVHQSLSHHLNSRSSISAELGSPHAPSNPAASPQSNSSSSVNTNLSAGSSSSPSSAVALPSHYPYNPANHFLHYSRLSSYYHPDYHLYNYFTEPKFKNTMVGNNLISNNLIGNNNLFSNEHSLFPSTNVF